MSEEREVYQTYSDKTKQAAEVIWHLGNDLNDLLLRLHIE